MSTSTTKRLPRTLGRWILPFIGVLFWISNCPSAQTTTPPQPPPEDQQIRITADKLETFNAQNLARFTGNVHATQADTVINCDRLDIFYERGDTTTAPKPKKPDKGASDTDTKGSVKRVVAVGNVKIRSADRVATTEQAEYTSETGIIVLSGENSRVNSGNNSVTGNKITMFRNEDRVVVESGEKKRVEAVVYSGDQKLMQ